MTEIPAARRPDDPASEGQSERSERRAVARVPPARVPADQVADAAPPKYGARQAPARPSVLSPNSAPVLYKATPPFSVRVSQLLWILSFTVGAFTTVYFFVIRKQLLPEIAAAAKKVVSGRETATYDSAADILFWVVFAIIVVALFAQIMLLVSFMARRPQVRWWQFATFIFQALLVLLSPEWVALGPQGEVIQPILTAQAALVLLALLFSVLPGAIRWSARRNDIRRGPEVTGTADL